jgi:hypothetical protein
MVAGTLRQSKYKPMSLMDPCATGGHTATRQRINDITSQYRKINKET